MKKILIILILQLISLVGLGQSSSNFSFELGVTDWIIQSQSQSHTHTIDTTTYYSGGKSLHISAKKEGSIYLWAFADFLRQSGEVQVSYSLKNESNDVAPAIILMISQNKTEYYDLNNKKLTKTDSNKLGWERYTITASLENLNRVAVGIAYAGKNDIWIDDLSIKINGIDIGDLQTTLFGKIFNDREFDNSSNIEKIKVSKTHTDKLYNLAKIWGLLKYYHPNIGKANFNWDYELFRIIPKVLSKGADFNIVISQWIDKVDGASREYKNHQDTSILKNDIFDWINKEQYGEELYNKLVQVVCFSNREDNYYVSVGETPIFLSENIYAEANLNDCGYRLLALFRGWNIIEYFFPYKHLTDNNWNNVLKEYIPKFIESENENEFYESISMFAAEMSDSHVNAVNYQKGLFNIIMRDKNSGLPVLVRDIENQCVIVDVDINSNEHFKIGDIITHIGGKSIDKTAKEYYKYFSASNLTRKRNQIFNNLILFSPNDSIKIHIKRGDEKLAFIAKTYTKNAAKYSKKIKEYYTIDKEIGYINLGHFNEKKLDSVMTVFKDKKGLIFDLRVYPKSFIIYKLGKYLMPKATDFATFKQTTLKTPGIYDAEFPVKIGTDNNNYYKGEVVILVNSETISRGEFTTMGLSVAPKATVIGNQTAAADGELAMFPMIGNYFITYTGLGVYYPDGSETQRVGVKIDEIVNQTVNGVVCGNDELLEHAIEIIKNK